MNLTGEIKKLVKDETFTSKLKKHEYEIEKLIPKAVPENVLKLVGETYNFIEVNNEKLKLQLEQHVCDQVARINSSQGKYEAFTHKLETFTDMLRETQASIKEVKSWKAGITSELAVMQALID